MKAFELESPVGTGSELGVVHDVEPLVVGSAMRRLGLRGPDPEWVSKLLDKERVEWLADRWDADARAVAFRDTDWVADNSPVRSPVLRLEGVPGLVAVEVLAALTGDFHRGKPVPLKDARVIVNAARERGLVSIRHLNPNDYNHNTSGRLRCWQERFDVATTDRDAEWDQGEVRLAVVKPGTNEGRGLPLGKIRQLWLRDMTTKLLRARCLQLGGNTLYQQATAMVVLSSFLAARDDHGEDPRALTAKTIQQFTETLTDIAPSADWHKKRLEDVSSVLTQARALELSPARLRAGFAVKAHHYPMVPVNERVEKAIPIATYRLIMGTDHLLGPTAQNLLASYKRSSFDGIVIVELERFMANFGRRLKEACKLTVDRVRFDDKGGAAISYDNFKEKRNRVWLPVDANEADQLRSHVAMLRDRFPDTPNHELCLFPKDALGGTIPIDKSRASTTHRIWVRTLEEVIVVAKLHKASGLAVPDLFGAYCSDLSGGRLTVNGTVHDLDTTTGGMLVDYRQNVLDWEDRAAKRTKREPVDPTRLALFPDWLARASTKTRWMGLSRDRLAPLGDDWVHRAASYASPGLPGGQLGLERVHPDELHIERLRHTYLQHAYNATRDLETVKELAGHNSIAVTYKSYVSTSDQLREAVETTSRYRRYIDGRQPHYDIPLATRRVPFVPGECGNPQVNDLGISGCPKAGDCGDCDHYISDPSNLPEIRQQIAAAVAAIATAKAEPDNTIREAKVIVLETQINTWRRAQKMHEDLIANLPEDQEERLLVACEVVRDFRESVRQSSGATFGTSVAMIDLTGPEPDTKGGSSDGVS